MFGNSRKSSSGPVASKIGFAKNFSRFTPGINARFNWSLPQSPWLSCPSSSNSSCALGILPLSPQRPYPSSFHSTGARGGLLFSSQCLFPSSGKADSRLLAVYYWALSVSIRQTQLKLTKSIFEPFVSISILIQLSCCSWRLSALAVRIHLRLRTILLRPVPIAVVSSTSVSVFLQCNRCPLSVQSVFET